MTKRWIGYAQQNIPGNQSFQMEFYESVDAAKYAYEKFCDGVGDPGCTMTLYYIGNDQAMIDLAIEYKNIGCPFDCADKYIERGPRGGINVKNN